MNTGGHFRFLDQKPGGCWLACLAMLTGLDLELFPDPPSPPGDRQAECDWRNQVTDLLGQHGWAAVCLGSRVPLEGYAIGSGPSPRQSSESGIWHAVIVKNGLPFFDPHPSRAMLGGQPPAEYELVVRVRPYRLPRFVQANPIRKELDRCDEP